MIKKINTFLKLSKILKWIGTFQIYLNMCVSTSTHAMLHFIAIIMCESLIQFSFLSHLCLCLFYLSIIINDLKICSFIVFIIDLYKIQQFQNHSYKANTNIARESINHDK